jgi:pSer/pThr/pTyr-binding forkhead associated (FHA) protein
MDQLLAWMGDNVVIVAVSAAGVLLLVALGVFLLVRLKKKSAGDPAGTGDAPDSDPAFDSTVSVGGSVFLQAQYTIMLSNPGKSWTLPVGDGLLIGRGEHCHVRLDDKSVSREQCKVFAQGTGLAVVDRSATNKTYLNNNHARRPMPIKTGDILKFGYETLRVDYIQSADKTPRSSLLPRDSDDREGTRPLF